MAYYTVYSSTHAFQSQHHKIAVVKPFHYEGMTRTILHTPTMTIHEYGDVPTTTRTNLLIFNPTVSYEDIVYEVYLFIQHHFKELCQSAPTLNIGNYKETIYFHNNGTISNIPERETYYSKTHYTFFRDFQQSGYIMYHYPKLYKQSIEGLKQRLTAHGNIPEIMLQEDAMVHCLRQAFINGDVPKPFYDHKHEYIDTYYSTM